jgi:hypothetical protein
MCFIANDFRLETSLQEDNPAWRNASSAVPLRPVAGINGNRKQEV